MSAKQFLLSTLAGFVTLFFLGFLFYAVLLMDFFGSHTSAGAMREAPIFWALIVSELTLAALGTIIFGRWASISTAMGGLKAGILIGLLLGIAFNFGMYATSTMMDMTAGLVDIVVTAIRVGASGAVIGLVLGKVSP
jgi:hypothetical protein